jgi:nucleoside-diphosphate-sugar epimerase
MKVCVTGSHGFIGQYLVKKLKDEGVGVFEYDLKNNEDILNEHHLARTMIEADIVFHLAAETGVPLSWIDPEWFYYVNVVGTAKVFRLARELKKKVVFASTGETYTVNSPYAATKVAGEAIMNVEIFKGADIVSLRILNPYGVGQQRNYVIPLFIRKALENQDLVLHNGGKQRKDYIYNTDLADLFWLAKDFPTGSKLDAGTGETNSIKELAEMAIKVTGSKSKLIEMPSERVGELGELKGDLTPFYNIGWQPKVTLEQGMTLVKGEYEKSL